MISVYLLLDYVFSLQEDKNLGMFFYCKKIKWLGMFLLQEDKDLSSVFFFCFASSIFYSFFCVALQVLR